MAHEFVRPRYYPISPKDILELGEGIKDPLARAMFFVQYLTGARISEVARMRKNHIRLGEDGYYEIRMVVLKKKKRKGMRRYVPIPGQGKARCFEDKMMKHVMAYLKDADAEWPFWKWGRPNDERPNGRPDYMAIYLRRACELKTEAQVKGKDGVWWDKLVTKPLHSHYLRKCRAAHLARHYNFDSIEVTLFFRWENPKMAMEYIEERDVKHAFSK